MMQTVLSLEQELSVFTQRGLFADADDGCQIAWLEEIEGLIVGSWEGTLKTFPKLSNIGSVVWRDPKHPEEPVRGLVASQANRVVTCNDFSLLVLDTALEKVLWQLAAKEADTCTKAHP